MVKVSFPFAVKHGGRFHAPHEALEVTEAEAKKLIGLGAKVLETPLKALEKASEPKAPATPFEKRPYTKRKG